MLLYVMFCRYLRVIPNETISVYSKGQNKPESVQKPLARSVDLVEANIKVNLHDLIFDCSIIEVLK